MTDLQKIVIAAVVSALMGSGSVFLTMRVEIAQLRERQANDYRELTKLMDLMRSDFQGMRGEVMGIISREK